MNMITGDGQPMTRGDWQFVHLRLVELFNARHSSVETAILAARLPQNTLPLWAEAFTKYLHSHGYRVSVDAVLAAFEEAHADITELKVAA
jgi:hypothetical protein